ncbi:MAG: T9SS type A sorting domain-containing protein [Bacteroidia bacterium]|nr:T9SS type A sorting domain-containing protein [Bacteroidia bacterium]
MHKCILLNLIFILFSGQKTTAQHFFEKVYGDNGSDVCIKVFDSGSRYILAGTTTSQGAGSYDVCLLLTDSFGTLLQNTIVGGFAEDVCIAATSTIHKEYLLAGYSNSFSSEQPFFMKFDAAGNFLWGKILAVSGWAQGVGSDANGNILITGYHSNPEPDVFVAKCDSSGNVIWAKSFGDSLLNEGRRIIATHDGGVLVSGTTHVQAGGPSDIFVLKTDSIGNLLWSYSYAVPSFWSWDIGYALQEMETDIIVGGLSYSEAFNNNPNSADALVAVLDSAGNVKQGIAIGSSEYDDMRDLSIEPGGRICITGATDIIGNGNTDMLLACFDTSGNIYNQILFGGSSFDHGLSVTPLKYDSYLVAGYSESFGVNLEDMYLTKTNGSYVSCNATTGNLGLVPIQILRNDVFDESFINLGVLSPFFSITTVPLVPNSLCATAAVDNPERSGEFSITPNPFQDYFTIETPEETSGEFSIILFDMTGRKINAWENISFSDRKPFRIQTNELAKGIYFCKLESVKESKVIQIVRQ